MREQEWGDRTADECRDDLNVVEPALLVRPVSITPSQHARRKFTVHDWLAVALGAILGMLLTAHWTLTPHALSCRQGWYECAIYLNGWSWAAVLGASVLGTTLYLRLLRRPSRSGLLRQTYLHPLLVALFIVLSIAVLHSLPTALFSIVYALPFAGIMVLLPPAFVLSEPEFGIAGMMAWALTYAVVPPIFLAPLCAQLVRAVAGQSFEPWGGPVRWRRALHPVVFALVGAGVGLLILRFLPTSR